jgi:hypothetical protein
MKRETNFLRNMFALKGRNTSLMQIPFIVVACVLLIAGSCKKDEDAPPDPNVVFKATLNGASEVPANASTGAGTATLTFNKDTKIFTVAVTYTGVTATASHIHKAAAGTSGGVVFGFTAPVTSPINYTSVALDATQEADLMANLYYVNVHSATFTGGEIRGQLIKQ